ncbi:zinc finger, CCHC-type containing protein, partial [Tanacetum coccineum]
VKSNYEFLGVDSGGGIPQSDSDFGLLVCKPFDVPLEQNLKISNEPTTSDPVINRITKYQKLIGKLIYLTDTKPDISYVVHYLSQFMHKPLKSHLKVLRYLKGSPEVHYWNYFKNYLKEPGKPKEVIYSNSKIIQVIKTYWELGHEHKFITEIVARRANECIVSITEPDYKNLNKNDIEDMYLLIMNGKVPDYAETGLLWSLSVFIRSSVIWERVHDFQLGIESYQQKVNLTAPTISFPGVEKHKMFSIIYEPVHGIIYKNSKKDKMVMRHSEIHKFCDATLNRVLEGLRSYNNDVKYGYIQRDLTNEEVEYLKLFEEEIEVRLKYRN